MEREEKVQLGLGVGTLVAFILGFRRVAGAVLVYDGYRAYRRHHQTHATFSGVLGGSLLVDPSWPEDVSSAVRNALGGSAPATTRLPAPTPIVNASLLKPNAGGDELLMGNWTMYDVTETQSPAIAAQAKTFKVGDTAALVLGQPSAPPMVFKVRVIPGGAPGRYAAQWLTEPPNGGPQFADFSPAHFLSP